MNKPVILAICGKSSSGKTTLARWLTAEFSAINAKHNLTISDTTRPPRVYEQQDIAYHFVSEKHFKENLKNKNYIEHTKFRDWYYGIHKQELVDDGINILVVNPAGLQTLRQYRRKYFIIPIYLQDRFIDRLRRSIDREGCWRFEYIRRGFTDWKDFLGIQKLLQSFPKHIILKNENGVVRKSRKILFVLRQCNII